MRAIVAVDAALTLASADEDESEAVALACVEFLLAETNAYYAQHVLARRTLQRLSDHVAGNIVDAVCAAVLRAEQPLPAQHFSSECNPAQSTADRHSVRSLPYRSPESVGGSDAMCGAGHNGASSPSRDSRSSGSSEKLAHAAAAAHGSGAHYAPRRRRKADKPATTAAAVVPDHNASLMLAAMPEVLVMPEEVDEDSETKVWRATCLRQLTASTKKLSSFSKWATVARAFAPSSVDPKVSMEVEITESAPLLLQSEVLSHSSSATSGIKMKSNVDSFAAVVDVVPTDSRSQQQHSSRGHWPHESLVERHTLLSQTAAASSTAAVSAAAMANDSKLKKGTGGVVLNDKLSRKKSALGGGATTNGASTLFTRRATGAGVGNSNGGKLWRYDSTSTSSGSSAPPVFVPERSDFNPTALPSTIQLAGGVVLSQGESLVEGPAHLEGPNTMSRKRFDLHQSLATDLLLHWNEREMMSRSRASSAGPSGFHHALEHPHMRPYEEVPPEPIPAPPFLSPIPTSALAIPRNHLAQSLSAPALRVRSPTHGKSAHGSGSMSLGTSASTAALPASGAFPQTRHRPGTALSLGKTRGTAAAAALQGHKSADARTGSAAAVKYQREFPKPQAGVVKLSQLDETQRLAWISP